MNFLNKLKFKYLWPYFLTIILIVLPWFLKSGYLFFTDTVWGPNINLDWTNAWFLLNVLIKGLSIILSLAFLEKIFISVILLLIIFGGHFFIKNIIDYFWPEEKLTNIIVFVYILSLFALFNPFVYDRALYGQFGVLIAYGFLLFVLGFLFKTWRTLDFNNLYKVSIFTALVLMFSVHFVFFIIPFYLVFLVAIFLKRREIKFGGQVKKFWLSIIFSVLIVLLINANWLIALAFNKSGMTNFVEQGISNQDLVAFQTAGKNGTETFSNVLLMSGFWGKEQFRYLDLTDISGWQRSFIFLSPIILYGVYLSFRKRSKKEKIFSLSLLLIFTLAVCLAVGIKSSVTNGFVMYLYNHLPLYKGLREPQKWVAVIVPIYLFYLTLGAYKLSKHKLVTSNKFVCVFILAAIIIMQAPSLLWGFNRQVKSTPYPSDWDQVNNLLINKSAQSYGCNERILFLPWHLYLNFNWAGKIIVNPTPAFFTCPVLSGTNMEFGGIYDNSQSSEGTIIDNWLIAKGNNGAPELIFKPIRYIILAKEVDYSKYSWLKDLSYVKPLLETKTLFVYEIK